MEAACHPQSCVSVRASADCRRLEEQGGCLQPTECDSIRHGLWRKSRTVWFVFREPAR